MTFVDKCLHMRIIDKFACQGKTDITVESAGENQYGVERVRGPSGSAEDSRPVGDSMCTEGVPLGAVRRRRSRQLASEFGINFGKNRYDFCIRTRITAIIRKVMTAA